MPEADVIYMFAMSLDGFIAREDGGGVAHSQHRARKPGNLMADYV